jgi:hypothetical protein
MGFLTMPSSPTPSNSPLALPVCHCDRKKYGFAWSLLCRFHCGDRLYV